MGLTHLCEFRRADEPKFLCPPAGKDDGSAGSPGTWRKRHERHEESEGRVLSLRVTSGVGWGHGREGRARKGVQSMSGRPSTLLPVFQEPILFLASHSQHTLPQEPLGQGLFWPECLTSSLVHGRPALRKSEPLFSISKHLRKYLLIIHYCLPSGFIPNQPLQRYLSISQLRKLRTGNLNDLPKVIASRQQS